MPEWAEHERLMKPGLIFLNDALDPRHYQAHIEGSDQTGRVRMRTCVGFSYNRACGQFRQSLRFSHTRV